jgi:hypothetical protein
LNQAWELIQHSLMWCQKPGEKVLPIVWRRPTCLQLILTLPIRIVSVLVCYVILVKLSPVVAENTNKKRNKLGSIRKRERINLISQRLFTLSSVVQELNFTIWARTELYYLGIDTCLW